MKDMEVKVNNWGKHTTYDSVYEWDCSCQAGDSGVVFSKSGNYKTAFFEAFPKKPSCFLRGEGETIKEAEESCWQKYQKVLVCNHEMERRDRTDGYGYCQHCSYSSMVFEPLTKCCKCGIPTAYDSDFRKKYYCKKHSRNKPKDPKGKSLWDSDFKVPRKKKKAMKKGVIALFRNEGIKGVVIAKFNIDATFRCGGYQVSAWSKKHQDEWVKMGKLTNKRGF